MEKSLIQDPAIKEHLVALKQFHSPPFLTRCLFVSVGEFGQRVKDSWEQLFEYNIRPAPFHKVYQWVHISAEANIQTVLRKAFDVLTDPQNIFSINESGLNVDLNRDQLVLVAGLFENEVQTGLKSILGEIALFLKEIERPQAPMFRIGALALESPKVHNTTKESILENLEFLQNSFHRCYLIDLQNEQGMRITSERDLEIITAQLIQFLKTIPSGINREEYLQWKSSIIPGRPFCGFNSITMVFPFKELAERLLIEKGAKIFEEALLPKIESTEEDLAILRNTYNQDLLRNQLRSIVKRINDPIDFQQGHWDEVKIEDLVSRIEFLEAFTEKMINEENVSIFGMNPEKNRNPFSFSQNIQ